MSMPEVLVALVVLTVVMTLALTLYDGARRTFKLGENVMAQQQVVRVAFDVISADLEMAGFNTNPDGIDSRPDEQIEAAYDRAISIRADLDGATADAGDPEEALADAGLFETVSTGNDEIVTYVLAKQDGSSSDTLTLWADLAGQTRDGAVERIDIPNVALRHDDPPYTLYAITFNNDEGSVTNADFIVRRPLADDIRSMRFRYYDLGGAEINGALDPDDPSDDIGGAETPTAQLDRARVRRIGLELETLTRDPDPNPDWYDPTDTDPDTRRHRKFGLTREITPLNLGIRGMIDLDADTSPPSAPGAPTLVPGHCGGLYVDWPPNPAADKVDHYRVLYGPDANPTTESTPVEFSELYLDQLADTQSYYVRVIAVDQDGNPSAASSEVWIQTADDTTPRPPQQVEASTGIDGVIELSWEPVGENEPGGASGDPATPRIRDLQSYSVSRASSADHVFTVVDEIASTPFTSYIDTGVRACVDHHYLVESLDGCGGRGTPVGTVSGQLVTSLPPEPPVGLQAVFLAPSQIRLSWELVERNVNGEQVYVDTYRVYHSQTVSIGQTASAYWIQEIVTVEPGQPAEFIDNVPFTAPQTNWYRIEAEDGCGNISMPSAGVAPECTFTGVVSFVTPIDGQAAPGTMPIEVKVDGGLESYERMTLSIEDLQTGTAQTVSCLWGDNAFCAWGGGSGWRSWTYADWINSPPTRHALTATVQTTSGCESSVTIQVEPE